MHARHLVWLCLVACGPGPEAAPIAAAPAVPGDRSPVPTSPPVATVAGAVAPVPGDSLAPPRLLRDHVASFDPLADGSLLVVLDHTTKIAGSQRLDPTTGTLTAWSQGWRPGLAGWKVDDPAADDFGAAPRVSPDGQWVVMEHTFTPQPAPRPGVQDLVALVVSRADGSEPRCVGVGILEDEGDPPEHMWTSDGRLIGGWSGQCEPDARGKLRSFPGGAKLAAWPRPMRWFNPHDGSNGEVPGVWHNGERDPLGDGLAAGYGGKGKSAIGLYDVGSGKRVASFVEPPGQHWFPEAWVAADAVMVDVRLQEDRRPLGQRVLFTDGRDLATPAPSWRAYTRLPGEQVLFTRDAGASVEQGRVDWRTFTVESSRARADLKRFTGTFEVGEANTWRPGLGGLLIHDTRSRELYLAPI